MSVFIDNKITGILFKWDEHAEITHNLTYYDQNSWVKVFDGCSRAGQ